MQPEKGFSSKELSPEVLKAQERLLKLRAERGFVPRDEVELCCAAASALQQPNWNIRNAQTALQYKRLQAGVITQTGETPSALLTDTLVGWGKSEALCPHEQPSAPVTKSVIAHPTMLLAMLKQNLEAPGRVYLLLRSSDGQGRGWLEIEHIRRLLTSKDSPWRICGWRRLRQLLNQGEGIFWQRDHKGRLWLKGMHKIACTLDCGRLSGFPILLPIATLLGGIQAVRGAFYAAFHSGRASNPISRQTLQELSGVPERSQRAYDHVAKVERQENLAIGERYSQEQAQERAWKQGRAVFRFIDVRGLQGRPRAEYLAWHLPNSYTGPYERRSRANRKRVNRKLADLVKKGIPGTGEETVERLFWPNGALAAKGYCRDPRRDAYWPVQAPSPGYTFWRVMLRFKGK